MSKLCVISVFDRAAGVFGRPIFVPAVGVGIRSFMDEINRNSPDNNMYAHPDDFDLFHLGFFDEDEGSFLPYNPEEPTAKPKLLMLGKQARDSDRA